MRESGAVPTGRPRAARQSHEKRVALTESPWNCAARAGSSHIRSSRRRRLPAARLIAAAAATLLAAPLQAGGLNEGATEQGKGLPADRFVSQRGPATVLASVKSASELRRAGAASGAPGVGAQVATPPRLSGPREAAPKRLSTPRPALAARKPARKPIVRPNGRPVRVGRITSRYGWRKDPLKGGRRFHSGTDFAAPQGTPIYSVADGVVTFAGVREHYGNVVEVYHGQGVMTRYAHNYQNDVRVGDRVLRGDLIAQVGMTGRTTGPHVHFEVRHNNRPIDPTPFILGKPAPKLRITLKSKK